MVEPRHDVPPTRDPGDDSEIDLKTIVRFAVGLVAVTLLALGVMWWMSVSFKKQEEAKDPAPPPLAKDPPPAPPAQARLDPIPPGPRLQPSPPRDMDELRAQDKDALTTYGWVDPASGVVRIPVERAIEILAEKGRAK